MRYYPHQVNAFNALSATQSEVCFVPSRRCKVQANTFDNTRHIANLPCLDISTSLICTHDPCLILPRCYSTKKILVILHGHAGSSSRTTSLAGDLRLRLRASLRASRANLASHPPPAKPRRVTRRNSSLRRIRGHPMRKKHLAGALELPRLLSPWQMKARRCQASVNGERGPEHQWD